MPIGGAPEYLLRLQEGVGNRAVARLVSGRSLHRSFVDWLPGVREYKATKAFLRGVFTQAVERSRATSTPLSVPPEFHNQLVDFASESLEEDLVLLKALDRVPNFHTGGAILELQPDASAMTLDRDVFVRGTLDAATYVHEMVHVAQYGKLGPLRFLELYFGETGGRLALHLLYDLPFDPFRASVLERQAYAIERRFVRWQATRQAEPREESLSHVTAVPQEPRRRR